MKKTNDNENRTYIDINKNVLHSFNCIYSFLITFTNPVIFFFPFYDTFSVTHITYPLCKFVLIVNSYNPRIGKQILMGHDIRTGIMPLHADE